ncbi:hypothetical protein UAJ10_23410 [Nitrospirillum sp. BR 11164]|uniref:hypothetical protein n=1 Tax=Nitrospirillum sp. BR 11164 TaxID=3104324 RepID=UPI002AFF6AC8|nr:hypothetical protein [Nitrospirillum sp. BR 11164]MEA1651947.1 hypothetical protein [Nitrospirillum sp. BR 11164]
MARIGFGVIATLLTVGLLLSGCGDKQVKDEAMKAGRAADTFPAADEDYFKDMDGGAKLTQDEVIGRNNWIVWTGGNDRFWDIITNSAFGNFDLLKTISSHKTLPFGRHNRFEQLGLMNEPCFVEPTEPSKDQFGLWLDQRVKNDPNCPDDPFANEKKYPGVKIGARGTLLDGEKFPVGSYYGYPTGIVGLRLFPNPDFDEKAKKHWDAKKYYEDPDYYNDKNLVRPYRVGMACGFCHVGPSPTNPPADPENPKWENMSAVVGAQYFWIDRIFGWNYGKLGSAQWKKNEQNYLIQLVHTSRPGALDTSLVSTDYINNPRTMNAVYELSARMNLGKERGLETLSGPELNNEFLKGDLNGTTVATPHVLKDGSDSVGVQGALNRVYINIGLFSEEWLRHFNPLFGGVPNTAIQIEVGRKNSSYWQATEAQTLDLAKYFLNKDIQKGHKLADAPGGKKYMTATDAQLDRGKEVFAETCAGCHSSKQPPVPKDIDFKTCNGPNYLVCWDKYWAWVNTPEFKEQMKALVKAPDFLEGNYLSTDMRVPVTLLQTNACSPLATNAIAGNIWDNFSSTSYKQLPSVGTIKIHDPFTGEEKDYVMPAGGRGYTRVPSLVALWSTAPYLVNNSVGWPEGSAYSEDYLNGKKPYPAYLLDPSVDGRVQSFKVSIKQMLWPETRPHDKLLGDKGVFFIDRTSVGSYLVVPGGFLPGFLKPLLSPLHRWLPSIFGDGDLMVGPIPKDTPVNILSNTELYKDDATLAENLPRYVQLLQFLKQATHDLARLPKNATDEEARKAFANLRKPLLDFSKCPDFEVNRGHYFGTSFTTETTALNDDDKNALIEFLKTF